MATDAAFPSDPADRPDAPRVALLLVEDDEGDAYLVRELLDGTRIDVRVARTLAEARASLHGVDCVLLDLGLPDARGLDGLRRLRSAAGRVPVVVLTGLEDEALGLDAVAAGAQDYLFKNHISAHRLTRTVRYAVERRHVEDMESALLEERLRAAENVRLERGLLPQPLVRTGDIAVLTRYRPGGGRMLLGGDFYDVVQDADGTVHALIGDVAGHGPDEAAVGVALRIAWRTLVLAHRPAEEIMHVIDRVLVHERHEDSLLATVCTVAVAPDRREAVAYVAGHPPPLLYANGRWTAAPTVGGPSLGLVDGAHFPPTKIALPDDWRLLLYTDGLVDGRAGDDRLGVEGLLAMLGPDVDLDRLTAQAARRNGGPLVDDVAMLLLSG